MSRTTRRPPETEDARTGRQRPSMLVASTGGHLTELIALWPRLRRAEEPPPIWVTFESEQTRSMLSGERVVTLPTIEPRDTVALARALTPARKLVHRERPARVLSTGSGIALAVLPWAANLGLETTYIESAARVAGPSLTGRILARHPRISTLTQVPSWADERWLYGGSLLDEFEVTRGDERPIRRVFVTLGTQDYPFTRLVRRLEAIAPPEVEIVWQTGNTPAPGRGTVHQTMDPLELAHQCRLADVVVGHAGAGTLLMTLQAGHAPVIVPRVKSHGEHVDDHQAELAGHLGRHGLGVPASADSLAWADLVEASRLTVERTDAARPILDPRDRDAVAAQAAAVALHHGASQGNDDVDSVSFTTLSPRRPPRRGPL